MGSVVWKGVSTRRRYEYMQRAIPGALLNPFGQPLTTATYNGETVILADHDGSVARAIATGPPPGASVVPQASSAINDVYDAYVLASPWEQAGQGAPPPPGGGAGGGAGPIGGVPFGGGW